MSSTTPTPPAAMNELVLIALPLTLVLGLGTGGLWPVHRQGTGGSFNQYTLPKIAGAERTSRIDSAASTAADDIDYVKSRLRLTTTELARYLGVSRQAVYDWRSGAHVKSHNISKLENLRAAADVIDRAGWPLSALQINRKLPGGRTLLEAISSGGNGYEAAQALVNLLRREIAQRRDRSRNLAGRKPISEGEFDPGMAALRESI